MGACNAGKRVEAQAGACARTRSGVRHVTQAKVQSRPNQPQNHTLGRVRVPGSCPLRAGWPSPPAPAAAPCPCGRSPPPPPSPEGARSIAAPCVIYSAPRRVCLRSGSQACSGGQGEQCAPSARQCPQAARCAPRLNRQQQHPLCPSSWAPHDCSRGDMQGVRMQEMEVAQTWPLLLSYPECLPHIRRRNAAVRQLHTPHSFRPALHGALEREGAMPRGCRTTACGSARLLAELADALEEVHGVHDLEGALLALQDRLLARDEDGGEGAQVRICCRRREICGPGAQRGQRDACAA